MLWQPDKPHTTDPSRAPDPFPHLFPALAIESTRFQRGKVKAAKHKFRHRALVSGCRSNRSSAVELGLGKTLDPEPAEGQVLGPEIHRQAGFAF